jgi:hypothetical protein
VPPPPLDYASPPPRRRTSWTLRILLGILALILLWLVGGFVLYFLLA